MQTRKTDSSDFIAIHVRVARTPEEFNEYFASGEAFEADEELAAKMGFFPTTEDVVSDDEFFAPPDPNEPEAD